MSRVLGLVLSIISIMQVSIVYAENSLDAADGSPTNVVEVDNSGNVDINTKYLKIDGDDSQPVEALIVRGAGEYIRLKHDGTKAMLQSDGGPLEIKPYVGDDIIFMRSISSSESEEVMRLTGDNVGIGTSSPSQKLTVGGSNTTKLRIESLTQPEAYYMDMYAAYNAADSYGLKGYGGLLIRGKTSGDVWLGKADAVKITSDGNVGIDTESPQAKLHVNGNIIADGSNVRIGFIDGSQGWAIEKGTSEKTTLRFDADRARFYSPVGGEVFTVRENGNIGIGEITPTSKLHIKSTNTSENLLKLTHNPGNSVMLMQADVDDVCQIDFGDIDDADIGYIRYHNVNNHMAFRTNNAERLRIDADGNVGIGTSSPAAKLAVRGSIKLEGGSAGSNMYITPGTSVDGIDCHLIGTYSEGTGHRPFVFRTNSTNRMIIGSNGNIGIGTMDPSAIFDIHDGVGKFEFHGNEATSGYTAHIKVDDVGMKIGHNSSGRKLSLQTGNEDRLTISMDGDVGIGTIVPEENIHIKGTAASEYDQEDDIDDQGIVGIKIENTEGYAGLIFNSAETAQNGKIMYRQQGPSNAVMLVGATGIDNLNFKVKGTVTAKTLNITQTGWADFVFDPSYKLASLDDVEKHIQKEKHLPEIPSAEEVAAEGVDVGQMQAKLLQKVEELTLYLIDQNKRIDSQSALIDAQSRRIEQLEVGTR